MTDYNDGEWHNLNGDYPEGVHPQSCVTYVWHDEHSGKCGVTENMPAAMAVWSRVLKFRVTEPFHEPRVIWVNEYSDGVHFAYDDRDHAQKSAVSHATRVAVRYVEAPE